MNNALLAGFSLSAMLCPSSAFRAFDTHKHAHRQTDRQTHTHSHTHDTRPHTHTKWERERERERENSHKRTNTHEFQTQFFASTEPSELLEFQKNQKMDGDKPAKLDEKEKVRLSRSPQHVLSPIACASITQNQVVFVVFRVAIMFLLSTVAVVITFSLRRHSDPTFSTDFVD